MGGQGVDTYEPSPFIIPRTLCLRAIVVGVAIDEVPAGCRSGDWPSAVCKAYVLYEGLPIQSSICGEPSFSLPAIRE